MSEGGQHIDRIFRDSISSHEEEPSLRVFETLRARLDKDAAAAYKRKYIIAKRTAILFLSLFLLFVLYETTLNRNVSREELIVLAKAKSNALEASLPKSKGMSMPSKNTVQNGQAQFTEGNFLNPEKGANTIQENIVGDKEIIEFSNSRTRHWANKKFPRELGLTEQRNRIDNSSNFLIHKASPDVAAGQTDSVHSIAQIIDRIENRQHAKIVLPDVAGKKIIISQFKPYWTLTAMASPDWSESRLKNDLPENSLAQLDEKTEIRQLERHQPSFTAGILGAYQFKKHWALQGGLLYSRTSILIEPKIIYAIERPSGSIAYKYISSAGYAFVKPGFGQPALVGDSISTTAAQERLQYLSLPLILKYKIGNGKISVSPGLGASAYLLTSARIQTELEDSLNREALTIKKLEGAKLFYLSLVANADIEYHFYRKWSLNAMPGFRYAVTPITKNNAVKTYPYSFGIAIGVSARF